MSILQIASDYQLAIRALQKHKCEPLYHGVTFNQSEGEWIAFDAARAFIRASLPTANLAAMDAPVDNIAKALGNEIAARHVALAAALDGRLGVKLDNQSKVIGAYVSIEKGALIAVDRPGHWFRTAMELALEEVA